MRTLRFVSVSFLVVLLCILQKTSALKCRTEDGPTSDEVRKVIRTCMKRISTESENKTTNSDEYEDYDSSSSEMDSGEQDQKDGGKRDDGKQKSGSNQKGNGNGRNGDDGGRNAGRNRDDNRNADRSPGQSGRSRDSDYGYGMGRRNNDGMNQRGRYKRQYYDDDPQGRYGNNYQQTDRYNRERNGFMNSNGNNSSNNASGSLERDRACLMQCFFQEMKMTNNEGFPDKHKVLHVVTKDLRDSELRDFYTDSIQECFHMISMDNKLKDKCDYALKFVTCLADRGQANCNDWENETIMF
ncbi:general odorant-binding protein 71 [Topomyia yanbarensis]|uniref:general odorant-binding protein 71 n=1 Tax=Topomyia yanbarensis TaxID=2498891 RepID=UPI00273C7320|nr:general odorant-binding protein 71 [Topomyia yanbarensis]